MTGVQTCALPILTATEAEVKAGKAAKGAKAEKAAKTELKAAASPAASPKK